MSERTNSGRRTSTTGRCEHCDWEALATSYSEMVEMYNSHLREEHPKAWLRA